MVIKGLTTENIKADGAAETVAYETDFAIKCGIALTEEVVYPIHLLGHCSNNALSELRRVIQ